MRRGNVVSDAVGIRTATVSKMQDNCRSLHLHFQKDSLFVQNLEVARYLRCTGQFQSFSCLKSSPQRKSMHGFGGVGVHRVIVAVAKEDPWPRVAVTVTVRLLLLSNVRFFIVVFSQLALF
jgi:hypothetical protein